MGYYIDLKNISIDDYKEILKSADLLPSRMVLKDDIDDIFNQSRSDISNQTGISEREVLKLAKLTDLSRIRWVNHTFAYVLLEAGYDTAEKVANADYRELYEKVKNLNEEREIYKGHIGLHDMKLCVEAAKDVSPQIEF